MDLDRVIVFENEPIGIRQNNNRGGVDSFVKNVGNYLA